jgi:hypothetical protein
MPIDPKKKQSLLDAVAALRQAEMALKDASSSIEDDTLLLKITLEYNHLDSVLQQMVQAQAISDDSDFAAATASLKAQSDTLQADEDLIKKIVGDVDLAARIVGCIAQAITTIARL